jgi:hypothetical protein
MEQTTPAGSDTFAPVDEYALASRLSYFLWSSMPDGELSWLAQRGELRKNLDAQVKRMLADARAQAFVSNFVGQWLQARDVEAVPIEARIVLARDAGQEAQLKADELAFARGNRGQANQNRANQDQANPNQQQTIAAGARGARGARGNRGNRASLAPAIELNGPLRQAMRREAEMAFDYVVHEDRPITELIDADYTFLNAPLAKHYGIDGITGNNMRKVELPKDSPRGGVLTEGAFLVVTSNSTRTSPVKRGQFILDNILGAPSPPPPANVPNLEESEKKIAGHEPTVRESLELHRDDALCKSCHGRMDPLGLALENFNAMGMWRDKERNQPIEPSGTLISGEKLSGARDLKQIIVNEKRIDYYRCLTEKLLTYALGRGLEYYDVETVDQIVQKLQDNDGRFSALLTGVIESAPFQKRRNSATPMAQVQQRDQHE